MPPQSKTSSTFYCSTKKSGNFLKAPPLPWQLHKLGWAALPLRGPSPPPPKKGGKRGSFPETKYHRLIRSRRRFTAGNTNKRVKWVQREGTSQVLLHLNSGFTPVSGPDGETRCEQGLVRRVLIFRQLPESAARSDHRRGEKRGGGIQSP